MTTLPPTATEQVVYEFLDAFAAGDTTRIANVLTEDAVLHVPGNNPLSGNHQGVPAILGFLGAASRASAGTLEFRLQDLLVKGDRAVILGAVSARLGDETLVDEVAYALTESAGRIASIRFYNYSEEHLKAFVN